MRNLFWPPSEALTSDISLAMRAILATTPLAHTHERELPYAVRDLSRLLTQDRSQLSQSYWVGKRLLYAYCRYFLPWNLLRLSWFLPNLDLPMEENGTILDLGSGPLTFPIALWLTRPSWRNLPLTIICVDVSPAPLAAGRDIFKHLAPDSPWVIETVRAPLEKALGGLKREVRLITAGNVLNEVKPSRETPLEERLAALCRRMAGKLAENGRFLAMEPGTRLGGKLMALTRFAAFSAHLVPESPCPHWGPCPMLQARANGWCHFSHSTAGVPSELVTLTSRAKLGKEHLNLSCMLLRKAAEEEKKAATAHMNALDTWNDADVDEDDLTGDDFFEEDAADTSGIREWAEAYALVRDQARGNTEQNFVRILSDPIRLPDESEAARYACSARGLVLAKNAFRMPSGAAVAVRWPEKEARDAKSGALILELPKPEPGNRAPEIQKKHPKNERKPAPKRPAPKNPGIKRGRHEDGRVPHEDRRGRPEITPQRPPARKNNDRR
jgi:hypothetical protein